VDDGDVDLDEAEGDRIEYGMRNAECGRSSRSIFPLKYREDGEGIAGSADAEVDQEHGEHVLEFADEQRGAGEEADGDDGRRDHDCAAADAERVQREHGERRPIGGPQHPVGKEVEQGPLAEDLAFGAVQVADERHREHAVLAEPALEIRRVGGDRVESDQAGRDAKHAERRRAGRREPKAVPGGADRGAEVVEVLRDGVHAIDLRVNGVAKYILRSPPLDGEG
jgi:hypothetical protein